MIDRLIQLDASLDEAITEFKEKDTREFPISQILTSPTVAGIAGALSGARIAGLPGAITTGTDRALGSKIGNNIYRRGDIVREKARRRKGKEGKDEFKGFAHGDAHLDAIEFARARKLGKAGRRAKVISKRIKEDPYS